MRETTTDERKQVGDIIGLKLRDPDGVLAATIREALARGERLYVIGGRVHTFKEA